MNSCHRISHWSTRLKIKLSYNRPVLWNTRFPISLPLNVSTLRSAILGTYNNQYIFSCYATYQSFSYKIMSLRLPKMKMQKQQVEYWLHLDLIVPRAKEWKKDWEMKTDIREKIDQQLKQLPDKRELQSILPQSRFMSVSTGTTHKRNCIRPLCLFTVINITTVLLWIR